MIYKTISAAVFAGALLLGIGMPVNAAPAAFNEVAGTAPGFQQGQARRAAMAVKIASDPSLAAIADLHALERLYRREQKPEQAMQMYTDVIARTRNLGVRNFAERRLARLQYRQGEHAAAEATLKRNLEHNLDQLGS